MTSELDRVRERLRQNRAARARPELTARTRGDGTAPDSPNSFPADSKAFDLLTGEHVEVIGGYRENVVVPARER